MVTANQQSREDALGATGTNSKRTKKMETHSSQVQSRRGVRCAVHEETEKQLGSVPCKNTNS